ncbi:MAG: LysE family translocator [Nisaea sp.]|jgi:threonine/homoserine/homoserine lactone efflux protein|uniref:LysE family translocator n=1 Tax=Nisaea sp. TaxID=2024842 RepID=UPI001B21E835|nr:LysE family translocator [Nisaea sp.]MBO6559561.1 LysE family translocator [Nisaea sp.]
MTLETALAFALGMVILTLTPGPSMLTTIAKSLANGFWSGFQYNIGVCIGDLIFLMLAIFGLQIVAELLGDVFFVVKWVGAAYLLWLGTKLWLAKPVPLDARPVGSKGPLREVMAGILITLGNPKVILFYGALLPTFVDLNALVASDIAILAGIVVAAIVVVNNFYGLMAARARKLFRSARAVQVLNRSAGGVMIGAGLFIATR